MKLLIILLTLFSLSAMGSIVAVIDSGTDLNHETLINQIWTNPGEIAQNDFDDDGNGLVDDFHGWNFAENNSHLIDYSYLGHLTENVKVFFKYQAKMLVGDASEQEIAWLKEKYADKEFIKKLGVYANFMHGTHVAGISARDSEEITILPIKLIPTEIKLPFSFEGIGAEKGLGAMLFNLSLDYLASIQMKPLRNIATYVGANGADIANGSFGTGYKQAKMIVAPIYKVINFWRKNISDEQKEEEIHGFTVYFLNSLLKYGKEMAAAAPNTLFVFAAGNDGTNNDEFPTSPAGVRANNVITVAATYDRINIASFSNFGETVDVAAPGVNILSAAPGNNYIRISGTSQASPMVANLAAKIKDANPALYPVQIKKILMSTVDKKDYLLGKVKSAGIINQERAVYASALTKEMSVDMAIKQSNVEVSDVAVNKSLPLSQGKVFVLPLPSPF